MNDTFDDIVEILIDRTMFARKLTYLKKNPIF